MHPEHMSYLSIPNSSFYVQLLPWSCAYALLRKVLEIHGLEYEWELPGYTRDGTSMDNLLLCLEWHKIQSTYTKQKVDVDRSLKRGDLVIVSSKPGTHEHVSLMTGKLDTNYSLFNHIPLKPWMNRYSWADLKSHIAASEDETAGFYLLERAK